MQRCEVDHPLSRHHPAAFGPGRRRFIGFFSNQPVGYAWQVVEISLIVLGDDARPTWRHHPTAFFRSGKGADLVLFQMEVLARVDSDLDLVPPLEVLEEMPFLVAQEIGHCGVNLNHDPVPGQASMISLNFSKDLVADGLLGL